MKSLIFQTPVKFKSLPSSDVQLWLAMTRVMSDNVSFIDRTCSINAPIRMATHPLNALPNVESDFNMSFDDCVIDRAKQIYQKHLDLQVPIRLQWSGGIDSTSALMGFIDYLGMEETSKCLEVVMNHSSIMENPMVWEQVIRKENFKIINSSHFDALLDSKAIIVNGECGDQVQGSDMLRYLYINFGDAGFDMPWTEDLLLGFVKSRSNSALLLTPGISDSDARKITDILATQAKNAPVEIDTMYRLLAWYNLSCKWNSTYYRVVTRVNHKLDANILANYYFPFFASDNFQRWSMTNNGEKHKGNWTTYKWKAKDYVCKILGNQEYQAKHRYGSLVHILAHTERCIAIDDEFNFYNSIVPEEWYSPNNSFK